MPTSYRVIIMPRASSDLVDICTYIEQDSPQNAKLVAQRLLDAIDSLQTFPHRHKVHRTHRDRARIVRSMSIPPFIIYYRILETPRAVELLTVRDGRREQPTQF